MLILIAPVRVRFRWIPRSIFAAAQLVFASSTCLVFASSTCFLVFTSRTRLVVTSPVVFALDPASVIAIRVEPWVAKLPKFPQL